MRYHRELQERLLRFYESGLQDSQLPQLEHGKQMHYESFYPYIPFLKYAYACMALNSYACMALDAYTCMALDAYHLHHAVGKFLLQPPTRWEGHIVDEREPLAGAWLLVFVLVY
jgi:hypothetical protein